MTTRIGRLPEAGTGLEFGGPRQSVISGGGTTPGSSPTSRTAQNIGDSLPGGIGNDGIEGGDGKIENSAQQEPKQSPFADHTAASNEEVRVVIKAEAEGLKRSPIGDSIRAQLKAAQDWKARVKKRDNGGVRTP